MKRKITTTVENILSLIYCSGDYGFNHNILMYAFSIMLNERLSYDEIEQYALSIKKQEGYTHEDYEEVKRRLIDFKNKYCD